MEWSCSDEWMDVRGVQNRAEIIDELEDEPGGDDLINPGTDGMELEMSRL